MRCKCRAFMNTSNFCSPADVKQGSSSEKTPNFSMEKIIQPYQERNLSKLQQSHTERLSFNLNLESLVQGCKLKEPRMTPIEELENSIQKIHNQYKDISQNRIQMMESLSSVNTSK